MRSIFAILLPTKFPSAKLGTPETEAFIDTINSGDDVPKAITVIPITNLDILNDFDGRFVSYCLKKKIEMRSGETDKAITVSPQYPILRKHDIKFETLQYILFFTGTSLRGFYS